MYSCRTAFPFLVFVTLMVAPSEARCGRSTLKGYNHSVSFGDGNFKLHWRVSGKNLFAALQALPSSGCVSGWLALGWSPDGSMAGSDAVVGNLKGSRPVRAFVLDDGGIGGAASSFSLGQNPRVVKTSGGLFVMFARAAGSGHVPVRLKGQHTLIFACSDSNSKTLGDHGENYDSFSVDFSCKS